MVCSEAVCSQMRHEWRNYEPQGLVCSQAIHRRACAMNSATMNRKDWFVVRRFIAVRALVCSEAIYRRACRKD